MGGPGRSCWIIGEVLERVNKTVWVESPSDRSFARQKTKNRILRGATMVPSGLGKRFLVKERSENFWPREGGGPTGTLLLILQDKIRVQQRKLGRFCRTCRSPLGIVLFKTLLNVQSCMRNEQEKKGSGPLAVDPFT